jgi:starch synthase
VKPALKGRFFQCVPALENGQVYIKLYSGGSTLKVTMIAREFPPYVYGGAGVHVGHLVQELSKMMRVEVRCFGDQKIEEKTLRVTGYNGWRKLNRTEKFELAVQTLSTNLATVCDKIDSDVVHTHTWYGHFAGFLAKMLYNIPFIATSHTIEALRPWKEDSLGRGYYLSNWLERTGIESADKIIAVSEAMKEDVLKHFNVSENKIEVIHNGVDINKWQYTPLGSGLKKAYDIEDDYVLFVGRPTLQKGMEYLVDAADEIKVQVVMAAVGSDSSEYEERMAARVKSRKNVLWIRKLLSEEEYIQLYSGARVFVCPSIYEPFGIVNLEAMACQVPVVASAVGGITEIVIPEVTGLLIQPGDPKQIADSVNRVLRDRGLAKRLGESGRRRVEECFSWTAIAQRTKGVYETLS